MNERFYRFIPRTPTGNMDDRFDAFYINGQLLDGENFEYVKGSCSVLGNNGTHFLGTNINTGNGAAGFGTELVALSDHLPVFCDFKWGQQPTQFNSSLDADASITRFVRPAGPVAGGAGDSDLEIEGSLNGSFSSFGVLDFDLSGQLGNGESVLRAENVVLNMIQDNEFFTDGGPVRVYLASPAATMIPIDSAVQYQSGQNGIACVPTNLSAGAVKVATYAGIHDINGTFLPDGTEDPFGLYGDEVNQAVADALNQGGTLRLLAVPVTSNTAATYAGFTSAFGPPSLSADLVVEDGMTDVLISNFEISNGAPAGGIILDFNESDDSRISFFATPPTAEIAPVQILFTGSLAGLNPIGLTVTIEGFVNTPNLGLTVESFNFNDGEWEVIGSESTGLEDSVSEFVVAGDVNRFNGPGGLILTRVSWEATAPTFLFPWKISTDQFKWSVLQ